METVAVNGQDEWGIRRGVLPIYCERRSVVHFIVALASRPFSFPAFLL